MQDYLKIKKIKFEIHVFDCCLNNNLLLTSVCLNEGLEYDIQRLLTSKLLNVGKLLRILYSLDYSSAVLDMG